MKILYTTTISNTVNAFLIPHIQMLIDEGHSVDLAFNVHQQVNPVLIEMGCNVFEVPFSRSPLSRGNIDAYKTFKKIVSDNKYDLVHTHTPVASVIVRLVCKGLKDTKIFYTAHGFHFYKGAPLKNWLVYYTLEKWLSKYTDTLITINKEDYNRAKDKFKAKRVEYIPGVGLDINKFKNEEVDKEEKRKNIGVPLDAFVILSVGELNKNKNHEVVIKALSEIRDNSVHYIICGKGFLKERLENLVLQSNLENNIHFLGYRNDIAEIFKISDVFLFPSLREGLSVALMESMACGIPVICSNIRGNSDLISDTQGGYLVDPNNSRELSVKIKELIIRDDLRKEFGTFNRNIINKYTIFNVINSLKLIYNYDFYE